MCWQLIVIGLGLCSPVFFVFNFTFSFNNIWAHRVKPTRHSTLLNYFLFFFMFGLLPYKKKCLQFLFLYIYISYPNTVLSKEKISYPYTVWNSCFSCHVCLFVEIEEVWIMVNRRPNLTIEASGNYKVNKVPWNMIPPSVMMHYRTSQKSTILYFQLDKRFMIWCKNSNHYNYTLHHLPIVIPTMTMS